MLEMQAWSLGWEDPWRRKWQPTLVFLPGESHGQRSLTWGHRESDTIEHTYTAYEKPDKDSAMSDRDAHCDFEKHFPLLCNIIFSNYQRVPAGFGLKKLKANDYPEHLKGHSVQFSSVQSLSCVQLFATLWTAARQASLSITNSRSPLKLMSIDLVMPSNYLILSSPSPPTFNFPSIRVFLNESALCIRWPKYWRFSVWVHPMITQDWSPLEWTRCISMQSKGLTRVFSNTTVQKHQFFSTQLPSQSNSHIHTWPLEKQ